MPLATAARRGYLPAMTLTARPTPGLYGEDPNLHGDRRLCPFAAFLAEHPDRPAGLNVVVPWDERGLYVLAGYGRLNANEAQGLPMTTRRGHTADARTRASYLVPGLFRWREIALRWPALLEWTLGPDAFVPPSDWPWPGLGERLGLGLMDFRPLLWHLSMVDRRGQPRSANVPYRATGPARRGLHLLSAVAAGWQVPRPQAHEVEVEAAVGWLAEQTQWAVYIANPMLEAIPAYTHYYAPIEAAVRKNEIQRLPLSTTTADLKALPVAYRKPEDILRLPRRPFDLARTQRAQYLAPVDDDQRDPSRWTLPYHGPWHGDPRRKTKEAP